MTDCLDKWTTVFKKPALALLILLIKCTFKSQRVLPILSENMNQGVQAMAWKEILTYMDWINKSY